MNNETKLIDALKEEIEDYKEVLNKVAYGDHERTKSAIAQRVLGKYREKSKEAEYNSPPKNPPYITIDELRELEEINNSQPAPNQPSEDKLIEWTKEIELCLPQIKNRTEWHLLKHAAYYNPKQSLQPHKSTYGSFSHAVLGAEKTRVEKDNNPDHISGEAYEKKYTWVDMCNKFNEGIEFEQNHAKAQQPEIYSRLAVCLRRFMLAISTHPDYSNDDSEFGDLYSSGEEVLQEYATALHCKPNISTGQQPDTGKAEKGLAIIMRDAYNNYISTLTEEMCDMRKTLTNRDHYRPYYQQKQDAAREVLSEALKPFIGTLASSGEPK